MKRIYNRLKRSFYTFLKTKVYSDEINALQADFEARRLRFEQNLDLDSLISMKLQKHVRFKYESSLDKLSLEQFENVLSQAPPLEKNDLLKLIVDDLKVTYLKDIALNNYESHFGRGKLAGLVEFEEAVDAKIGEWKSLQQKRGDINKFDLT